MNADHMATQYHIGLSKQAIAVYRLLVSDGTLSVIEIGKRLHIAPTGVYRLVEHLHAMGIVTENGSRPARYSANDPVTARDQYIQAQQAWFDDLGLGHATALRNGAAGEQLMGASFISGRSDIFARIAMDYPTVTQTAHMAILGLSEGISPELLYVQKVAVERGVQCRIVVQEYAPENKDTLLSWTKNGATIRLGKSIGFHLIIFDNHISYLMWYDEHNRYKRTAVRFTHPGIARALQAVFETHWRTAVPIRP